jgi:hypothetical protein
MFGDLNSKFRKLNPPTFPTNDATGWLIDWLNRETYGTEEDEGDGGNI